LTIEQILAWADAHQAATGKWPDHRAGAVQHAPFDLTWSAIQTALQKGLRGLPAGGSLRRLQAEYRGVPLRPALTLEQVLAWADAHHAATGKWPTLKSGRVLGTENEDWSLIDNLLRLGQRGLPTGLSVLQMLERYRGVSDRRWRERLTIEQVLAWADAHRAATGQWPSVESGPVSEGPEDLSWRAVDSSLTTGNRGLPGGSTLVRLLAEHRGVRPALVIEQILAWADAHHATTGRWPTKSSGDIPSAYRENWDSIDHFLIKGGRGLPGGQSLSELFFEHRILRESDGREPLSVEQILAWADTFHVAHGAWPDSCSGVVAQAPGETWQAIDTALKTGGRGLAPGGSLTLLLAKYRGPVERHRAPLLTLEQVLAWADAYHTANGKWPTVMSGFVTEAPRESWQKIDHALRKGQRGLPHAGSLSRLLAQYRDRQAPTALRPLTVDQILAWADQHRAATGRWPLAGSGPIAAAPGETWAGVDRALRAGYRGLPGGLSLARLKHARQPSTG
jgi:hypothetical protein